MNKRELIINAVKDLAGSLLYYDRKDDEDLERGDIEAQIKSGAITVDEIVSTFKDELERGLK